MAILQRNTDITRKLDPSLQTIYKRGRFSAQGRVLVLVKCLEGSVAIVVKEIKVQGGTISHTFKRQSMVAASIPLQSIRALLNLDEVKGMESEESLPIS